MFKEAQTTAISWMVLAVCAAIVILRMALHYRRDTEYLWRVYPLYVIYYFFSRMMWRTEIKQPLPVRPGEGAIIVCNHVSGVDPWYIQVGMNRIVHWMVAREYCEKPGMAWLFQAVGAIPVSRRGVDTAATKAAIRYARQGELVGLFPEGRINMTDELLLPGRLGVALIALKARVPVIPCFVRGAPYDGTDFGCFRTLARVQVAVGEPIDLTPYYDRDDNREVLVELTRRFMKEMAVLAGRPDYEPVVAGRDWSQHDPADLERARRRMA